MPSTKPTSSASRTDSDPGAASTGTGCALGIQTKKVNWVLDADIRGFFDTLDHEWLVKFVEHRIADRRVVRLIQKWLNAGVLEEGNGYGWKKERRRAGVPRRCWPMSISITCSTCGSDRGDRSGRTAM